MANTQAKRVRLSISLPLQAHRRIGRAAAKRNLSIQQYLLEAVHKQMQEEKTENAATEHMLALTAQADPVLAQLWDNSRDAAYDQLESR